jgi:ureidoacrylate peracid hydrolase
MAMTFEDKIDPSRAALIVVDVQNYYCHPDLASKWEDYAACTGALANLHALIDEARRIGLPVIYLRNWHEDCTDSEAWFTRGNRTTVGLRSNTWESDWYQVEPRPGEPVVNKHRYSGFSGARLDAILRTLGRTSVIMTGVATNVCVESTARDALFHDYHVVFTSDATATSDGQALHEGTLANMRKHFGVVCTTEQVLAVWRSLPAASQRAVPALER